MKIGLSTANYFPEMNTEDMIDHYGALGIDSVEIFLNTYSEMEEGFIAMLRDRCDRYGITVNSVHVMSMIMEPCLFDLLPRRRQDFLKLFRNTLRCVRGLGSDIYTFHGVPRNMADPRYYDHLAGCYDELYELSGEAGVRLAQENVAYLASGDPAFLREMKSRMKQRMLHTFDIKQAIRARVNPYDFLEVLGEDLINVHLNDHNATDNCLLPGRGTFDFSAFFRHLQAMGYAGNGILELYRQNFKDEADLMAGSRILTDAAEAIWKK
ncbi:sugar phosphate isomerase/epimerase [Proteiniclasticum sp. QWL-01]|uniref:sugar phosphate isomerase/epimerase family protein n=1 Tax=Proteiniclasticum sp. QWL-01 TaxID=3036945 RepID=UPI00240F71C6|nr:sugar phosphate isomerase/epimerase [Proteiniclasticum sp. QWL-01]WFF72051.1 sugar phosphate isomerase/epimerase [Proteiniclasticum sp. QWL-01]